jgi:hypothetical protein
MKNVILVFMLFLGTINSYSLAYQSNHEEKYDENDLDDTDEVKTALIMALGKIKLDCFLNDMTYPALYSESYRKRFLGAIKMVNTKVSINQEKAQPIISTATVLAPKSYLELDFTTSSDFKKIVSIKVYDYQYISEKVNLGSILVPNIIIKEKKYVKAIGTCKALNK